MHIIVAAVLERQITSISSNVAHAWIEDFEERCVLEADRGDLVLVGVQCLEIVRVSVDAVAGDADIKDGVSFGRSESFEECRQHSSALIHRDSDGQRPWSALTPD